MKTYIGVKVVQAIAMTAGEAYENGYRITGHNHEDEGYQVEYQDGYKSWSPKKVFDEAYREIDNLTFGMAIEALKKGQKVARAGWNGKNMWLSYVDPYRNEQFDLIEKEAAEGTFLPWIGMKTADNGYVPWLASQTDILEEDWTIVK